MELVGTSRLLPPTTTINIAAPKTLYSKEAPNSLVKNDKYVEGKGRRGRRPNWGVGG